MTPKEFCAAANDITKRMGAHYSITVFFDTEVCSRNDAGVLSAAVYYRWPSSTNALFRLDGDDFSNLLIAIEAKWTDYEAEHHRQTIRNMALAIIRITSDVGLCSDAALRAEFASDEVQRFGARACADANALAGKGPFSITIVSGANTPVTAEG